MVSDIIQTCHKYHTAAGKAPKIENIAIYLIITWVKAKIKRFDMRRKTALERPKGSTEAHLILVKIYWFMFLHKTFDVSLNFLLAIWVDWWVQTDAFVGFRTKKGRELKKMLASSYRKYDIRSIRHVIFVFWTRAGASSHTVYAVAYGIGRDLHTFAGVVELCSFFCMNFPSATIRAAEFPLVYPEVNNL